MRIKSIFLFLVVSIFISCSNEDVDDNFEVVNTVDLIAQDSDLFDLMDRMTTDDPEIGKVVCIKFLYNFTAVLYNENSELQLTQVIHSDEEFSEFLGSVPEGTYINVSFPITGVLEDGTQIEITDKDELKENIDSCIEEEQEGIIGYCEGLLQECVWEVQIPSDGLPSVYENAVFDVADDGTVDFYHRGERYRGTWIVYFIEFELHININLDDSGPIGTNWNFDWKTEILSDLAMDIINDDGDHFLLQQECDSDDYCTTLVFEECELEQSSGIADFILENYLECIDIIAAPLPDDNAQAGDTEIDYIFTFYETLINAEEALNPLDATIVYNNIFNPQELYVRIEHPDTQEFVIVTITLSAIDCEE